MQILWSLGRSRTVCINANINLNKQYSFSSLILWKSWDPKPAQSSIRNCYHLSLRSSISFQVPWINVEGKSIVLNSPWRLNPWIATALGARDELGLLWLWSSDSINIYVLKKPVPFASPKLYGKYGTNYQQQQGRFKICISSLKSLRNLRWCNLSNRAIFMSSALPRIPVLTIFPSPGDTQLPKTHPPRTTPASFCTSAVSQWLRAVLPDRFLSENLFQPRAAHWVL